MNNTRNNTWAMAIVAVLVVLLVAMCACLFGLAVGVGIGQARARVQLENIVPIVPEVVPRATPAFPLLPTIPESPDTPDMPDMPEMRDLEEMLDMMSGALVSEVVADGPADQAGIAPGDVIVAVDGENVTRDTSLAELVRQYAPGDEVTLTLVRMSQGDMNQDEVVVTLGANPDDDSVGFLGVFVVPFLQSDEQGTP
ncbi:MAG: PDZ domain-containing protein [Caldilineales bacterium]